MDNVGKCFLIADEVGLGKTKSAKAVLYEMIRMKSTHDIHCIYMASNEALAKQNMNDEFLNSKEANEAIEIEVMGQAGNYDGLKGFQKNNAIQALRVLWDKEYSYSENTEEEAADESVGTLCRIADKSFTGRLSGFYPTMCQAGRSYIMQLSPQTSFYNPKFSAVYTGSETERDGMLQDFNFFLKWLKDKENTEKDYKKIPGKILLCEELEWALKNAYSGKKDLTKEDITEEIIEEIQKHIDNLNKEDGKGSRFA